MPRKHKKVSFSIPVASPGIATQNSFSLLSPMASVTGPNSPDEDAPMPSPSGFTPPPKKRREEHEGPSPTPTPSPPPDTGASSKKPKGKLETKIHTLALQRAKELLAVAQASEAIAAAVDNALAGLNGLAKVHGRKIAHQLNEALRERLGSERAASPAHLGANKPEQRTYATVAALLAEAVAA
jgi:hypothetical protein